MVYNGDAPSTLQRQLLIEMPDAREIPAVLEAAAQAASAGDLASAETLLHEVVSLQEARLSPLHPDLASTYNNLAVVSEMAGKAADAEQFYRRAYTIASRSLKPDDPLVTTSFNNLKDFCASRGVPLDVSAEAPAADVATPPERIPASSPPAASAPAAEPAPRLAAPAAIAPTKTNPAASPAGPLPKTASGTLIVGVLGAAALVALLAVVWPSRERSEPEADMAPATPAAAGEPTPAAPPAVAPNPPVTPPAPRAADTAVPAKPATPRPAAGNATSARVLEARVCQSLSTEGAEWRCVAPSKPATPGRLSFYTRVAAPADVRVRHRWYHGERLVQDVGLMVRANPSAGYRTYSRQTVNASGGGDWRVELRAPDGALLGEERFVVR